MEHQVASAIEHSKIPTAGAPSKFKPSVIWVALENTSFMGFCWLTSWEAEETTPNEIYMLAVKKKHRRRGVARQLVQKAKDFTKNKAPLAARIYHKSTFMTALVISELFIEKESDAIKSKLYVYE